MNSLVLATRKYKVGYEIRSELSTTDFHAEVIDYGEKGDKAETDALISWINQNRDKAVIVKSAYTFDGHYIGNPRMARFLVKRGIKPELADPTNQVCSVGFCEREQKWYGWSHRAICGFGIGSIVEEGDCTASSGWTDEYLAEHPEDDTSLPIGFVAKDLIDAKRMAMAFASSVG